MELGRPDPAPGPPDGRPSRRRRRLSWAAAGAVLVLVLGVVAFRLVADGGPAPLTRADVERAVSQGVERAQRQARNAPPDGAAAYRKILPSFVTITTEATSGGGTTTGLGAGVVVSAEGAVLTALHVVETAGQPGRRIRVRFSDGTVATARVESRQPGSDIAVLAVDTLPQVVVPAVMGGGVQVGDPVFPVGNPMGLQGTLTSGVVSSTGRTVRTEAGATLADLIQFDAAVNPGNSGGPLLDRAGQVVGVVTGLANPSAQRYFVGVGFAVPIATAGGAAGMPQR